MLTKEYVAAAEAVLARAKLRGSYQYAIAMGGQCLSGSDLRGRAKFYGSRYARSRRLVIAALTQAGVAKEVIGAHNRRYLVDCVSQSVPGVTDYAEVG